ncbi:hypothetical protein BE04_03895 [Sorangium cellulosum]|uniref:Secreted protein n=2 Tax=Sorangium cellulosum TaxID=56 RepID=A0A150PMV0_SORCE|nr:hypothetical protein [Sorangium cellulosum]AGP39025.1 hypothetical protein SCE1572_33820 [Sorangium cellulosum So0157-2]KYF57061.1 hypothetical protein BE04_03895 [Sorangium cellulosum]
MIAKRLFVSLALVSTLSTPALADEQFTAEPEEAELLQPGAPDEADFSLAVSTTQVWPQRTEDFSTYLFVRTDWKVHNPNAEYVQVNVRCDRYGYDAWYWIEPYGTVSGRWGCEGRTLYIFNNAPQNSSLFVQATTW